APIFHLHKEDRYRPTSLLSFLDHTRPRFEFGNTALPPPGPPLAYLDNLNSPSGGENVYLTSHDDVTNNPQWLEGARINSCGGTDSVRTGVILVMHKGEGVVDVFYFIFWAFNYGGVVLGKELGDHVGDWEHVMIRFKGGDPKTVWLSQHGNGEAYTYKALEKYKSGKRPVLYIANGSHAIYARPGAIDHTIPNFNTEIPFLLVDYCNDGPLFDPLLTSYAYSCDLASVQGKETESMSPFEPLTSYTPAPGWLRFKGHWGDQAYPDDDPRQKGNGLLGFHKFGDGPTGPAFKALNRKRTWPENSHAAGQIIRTSLDGSTRLRDTLKTWGWNRFGRNKKAMKVMGKPKRVDVYGKTVEDEKVMGKKGNLLVNEKAVDKA
ncbi:hypothetical protein BU25DRAFT_345322, partial [Macroventuria anomochaeta]